MRATFISVKSVKSVVKQLNSSRLALGIVACLLQTACVAPVGADKSSLSVSYRQTRENAVSGAQPSLETRAVLHRFDLTERFLKDPDSTLLRLHREALEGADRNLLFAL